MSDGTPIFDAHALSHAILPVPSLSIALVRYTALGFTCAHPKGETSDYLMGTEALLVHLDDGTFLKPLAVDVRETYEAEVAAGKFFTQLDQAYRFRRGDNGFSALAFTGPDAPEMFHYDYKAPDVCFITQDAPSIAIDAALKSHKNGVVGLRKVVMTEPNPTDFQYLLQDAMRQRLVDCNSFGMELDAINGSVSVLSPEGFDAYLGAAAVSPYDKAARGLLLQAIVFTVKSLDVLSATLSENGVMYYQYGNKIVVPPALGQGAAFVFEEVS